MFTVKQINKAGYVRLVETENVEISVRHNLTEVTMEGAKTPLITGWYSNDPDEDMLYVMNDNGATIHSFRFRPSVLSMMVPEEQKMGENLGIANLRKKMEENPE